MPQDNAALLVYSAQTDAALAVGSLRSSGFDMKKVSVAARERQPANGAPGCYHDDLDSTYCRELGEPWASLEGALSGWASLHLPGIGPVLVAGPLSGWIVSALENVAIFGGLSALGAGLYSIGIRRERIRECESALRSGAYLLLAHGASTEVARAKEILESASAGRVTT
jgi:hypothetical protein